jgi:hypothetical protein
MKTLLILALSLAPLATACGGYVEPAPGETVDPHCGADGYVLPEAQPGDLYRVHGDGIQSAVMSNGSVDVTFNAPEGWVAFEVLTLDGSGPLVVQLRDADGTVCYPLEQL